MKTKWIKCSEQSPGTIRDVWVTYLTKEGKRIVGRDWYSCILGKWNTYSNVIAWVDNPYPKPYRGDI